MGDFKKYIVQGVGMYIGARITDRILAFLFDDVKKKAKDAAYEKTIEAVKKVFGKKDEKPYRKPNTEYKRKTADGAGVVLTYTEYKRWREWMEKNGNTEDNYDAEHYDD